jgi:hypothetical protein
MNTKTGLLLLLVTVAAAVSSQASSTVAGPRLDAPYAVVLDSAARYETAPAEAVEAIASSSSPASEDRSEGVASLLMLFAFLGLIGVNLLRWSSDGSCKSERSVF